MKNWQTFCAYAKSYHTSRNTTYKVTKRKNKIKFYETAFKIKLINTYMWNTSVYGYQIYRRNRMYKECIKNLSCDVGGDQKTKIPTQVKEK